MTPLEAPRAEAARTIPSPSHFAPGRPPREIQVIGGGILGLATAREALRTHPKVRVTVYEKESQLAAHQTGRNSGVVHSGLYYEPGSLKALTCRRGKELLESFCREHRIAIETCGKVVVATDTAELARLDALAERARANDISFERIGANRLKEIEPHVAGVAALHVPESGIVDYRGVCEALAAEIRATGRGSVITGARVRGIDTSDGVQLALSGAPPPPPAELVINCGGLHADRLARAAGAAPATRIVPFRGEYFELTPDAEHLVRNLVYPVPDPRFPFLGVHFTRMVHGGVECGPNAVFALAREGYRWLDINPRDLADALVWPGTWRLFGKHWRIGAGEAWRSVSKRAFVRALQRLIPSIQAEHLTPAPSGVRAQALERSGHLLDDFALVREGSVLHVLNAPSPAATASLAIAERIVAEATDAPATD